MPGLLNSRMKTTPLYIEKLVFGGNGLGRHDGIAVFIPYTVPGDTVHWGITARKKRFCKGRLLKIIRPSACRVPPECPCFLKCGGCQWQHVEYSEQIRWKQDIFTSALVRGCGINTYDIHAIEPAPSLWNYRSRARLKVVWREGKGAAGFFQAGSHELVPVRYCLLLNQRLNTLLESAWHHLLEPGAARDGFSGMELEAGDYGVCRIILDFSRNIKAGSPGNPAFYGKAVRSGAEALVAACPFAVTVMARYGNDITFIAGEAPDGNATGPIICPVAQPEIELHLPPGGFSQINAEQNRTLVSLVTRAIREKKKSAKRILDLFCGMGNFTIPLASCCDKIHGVDASEVSIRAAADNARLNHVCNATFHVSMVETYVARMKDIGGYDVVLMDPPRTGAVKAATALASAGPSTIIYVSCDPMTLARDLKVFIEAGYMVRWSVPVDLFPHTYHIESVTVLDYLRETHISCLRKHEI